MNAPRASSRRVAAALAVFGLVGLLSPSASGGPPDPASPPPAAVPDSIGGVTETVAGLTVRDPFRGLEDRAAAAPWIDAHDAASSAWFEAHPDPALDARLLALSSLGRLDTPRVARDLTFFKRNDGRQEQSALYVRRKGGGKTTDRVLVDPNATDPSGKTALDWFFPSQTGRYVAYGASRDGTEDSTLKVLETETGKDLGLAISDTRWCAVSWLPDDSGFYYTRYPHGEQYSPTLRFHRMGDDAAKDVETFGAGLKPTDFPGALVSADGLQVAWTVEHGWTSSDLYLEDRATGKRATIVEGRAAKTSPVRVADGAVFAVTNLGAPRFRLVRIDPAHPDPSAWKDLVREGEGTLESAVYAAGKWAVKTILAAASRLTVYDADGSHATDVPLPEACQVYDVEADETLPRVAFSLSSFSTPGAIYEFSVATPQVAPSPVASIDAGVAPGLLSIRQVRYPSYDGTLVPMWIVSRADVPADGKRPVYLTGYGGFSVSLGPSFRSNGLAWVERGGVFAEPNLRGGGELGEDWHQAGCRERKFQVFEDFEYAMRWLIGEGIASPRTIGIEGGSNGGLLMGAMMTRCPELFSAAVGNVGLYDMMRFQKWPPAELWVDEYGSADEPKQAPYLLAYSPYHQIRRGVAYPAFLGQTAEQDKRVTWRHTAKFVAALEAASSSDRPLLFLMETKAGHGQGKNRSARVADASRVFRFLWSQTGGRP